MRLVTEVRTRCRSRRGVIGAIAFALMFVAGTAFAQSAHSRLSRDLAALAAGDTGGTARVIVDAASGDVDALAARYGGHVIRTLKRGAVVELPASSLSQVDADGAAAHVASDTPVERMMATTVVSTGADQVWAGAAGLPYTGAGIGVAIIDSGVSNHPELKGRIVASVDFLGTRGRAVDEFGHGTHVAGSVHAMAPGANIINLRVLDKDGSGLTSDAIDAIDWAIAHKGDYNIRVINLSLGHLPVDSYVDDPLCQAVERAFGAGIVVVAAAGNYGTTDDGTPVIGAIASPGTDPFALTVGALNTKGTPERSDDDVASYSSRGPTIDGFLKPDLVAPGNQIVSLAAPGSSLWREHPELRVDGQGPGYFTLSGTSMSTAVVSGAAALVLEANPSLAPLDVRIALQVTSALIQGASLIDQGAGSLNAYGAGSIVGGEAPIALWIGGQTVAPSGIAFLGAPFDVPSESWATVHFPDLVSGLRKTIVWSGKTIVWSGKTIVWSGKTIVWSGNTVVWSGAQTAATFPSSEIDPPGSMWGETIVWSRHTAGPPILWSTETAPTIFADTIVWSRH